MSIHSAFLRTLSVDDGVIEALGQDWRSAGLADKTKAVLDYSEQITQDATRVTDETIAGLRAAGCSDEEILEATMVAAFFNNIDRIADALGVALDDLDA